MNWRRVSLLVYPALMVGVLVADFGDPKQWNELTFGPVRMDLVVHLVLFVPWAFMARWIWVPAYRPMVFATFRFFMGVGILLAVGLEVAQYFLEYRVFSWEDMAFNLLGLGVSGIVSGVVGKFWD